jgi:hypothetical protein
LKTRYRQQVDLLRDLDDDSIVKKRKFVQIYAPAGQEAITKSNRRSDFRTARIMPFNLAKVFNSMLLKDIGIRTSNTTTIPSNRLSINKRKVQDLVRLNKAAARGVLKDITNEMSHKNTLIADLTQQLDLYKRSIGNIHKDKRKRINPQPNERFI